MIRELSAVVCLGVLAGCSSAPMGPAGGARDAVVDVFMTTDDGRLARWVLEDDGTMHFAGGHAARTGEWQWTGAGDPAEVAKIKQVVQVWGDRPIPGDGTNHVVWHVRVGDAGVQQIRGASAPMQTMWLALGTAGRERLRDVFDRVPEGDLTKYMREREAAAQGEE